MNNQIPFGYNQNFPQSFPGMNDFDNQTSYNKLHTIEQKLNNLENRVRNLESKLNMSSSNLDSSYNPYQTSMHMM